MGYWLRTSSTPIPPPPFVPAVDRPQPTGTTYTVSTAQSSAAIAAVYAACVSGDCIQFAPGTYDQNACFPSGWNKANVIVRAQSIGAYDSNPFGSGRGIPHWARFARNAIFLYKSGLGGTTSTISVDNVTIQDIWHKVDNATIWPADNFNWDSTCAAAAVAWGLIKIASNVNGAQIIYNECSMGWGTSAVPLDPNTKFSDYNSPATFNGGNPGVPLTTPGTAAGWGDATWLTYNRVLGAPYFIYGSGRVGNGITLYANYVHDMGHDFNSVLAQSGAYLQQHNWLERCYHDFGSITSVGTTMPASMAIDQNIFIDPCGNIKDSGGPHVDTDQVAVSPTGGGANIKPQGMRAGRNLLMNTTATTRGNAQYHFWQLSGGHYASNNVIGVAPKMRENIGFMSGSSHAADLGVSENTYFRANEVWTPASLNNGTGTVSTQLTLDGAQGVSTALPNKGLFADNVLEAGIFANDTPALMTSVNNAALGERSARLIPEATIFTGNIAVWPPTPYAAFEYRKKQAAYATLGCQLATIEDFILGALDWTGERPFAGFVDALNQTAAATIDSNLAWTQGGDPGDLLSFAPAPGITWRTVSTVDRTTPVQGASTSTRNVAVDVEYIIQQGTAPAQGTSTTFNSTLAGVVMPWTISSATTSFFPVVSLAVATPDIFRIVASSSLAASNGPLGTLALMNFKMAAIPAASMTIYSSPTLSVQVLPTTGHLRLTIVNAAGTSDARIETNSNACDNVAHNFLFSWDKSDPVEATGRSAYKDGVSDRLTSALWPASASTTGWSRAATNATFGPASGSQNLIIGAFYVQPNARVDINVAANRDKFGAGQMVQDGSGPTGTQAAVLLTGTAGQVGGWNDVAGVNWGSRGKYIKVGSTSATDVSGGPW